MKRRKAISAAVAVGSLACLAAWAAFGPRVHESERPGDRGGEQDSAATAIVPVDGWAIGQKRAYDVTLAGRFDGQGGDKASQAFRLDADFRLSVAPFAKDAHGTSLRVELVPTRVQQTMDGKASDTSAAARSAFAEPIALSVAPSGAIKRVYMNPAIDPLLHGVARSLVSALQVVVPDDRRVATWSVIERDSTGEFVAAYRRTGELELEKTRQKYLDNIDPKIGFQRRDRRGTTRLSLLETGIPRQIDAGYEETIAAKEARMTARTQIRMRLVSVEDAAAQPVAMIRDHGSSLDAAPATSEQPEAHYAALAKGQTIAGLARALSEIDAEDAHARAAVMQKLDAVFRAQGEPAVAEAAAFIRGAESADDARVFMGALEGAQTPAAQRALIGLVGDASVAHEHRLTSLVHLGLGASPTAETLRSLKTLAEDPELDQDLRSTALLALGGSLRKADPLVTQEGDTPSVQYLLDRARLASSVDERQLALDALGNTGHQDALAALDKALDDDYPGLRASAVSSLRHIGDPKADTLLADTALGDGDSRVRAQALGALRYRPLTQETQAALVDALEHDEDAVVRLVAIDIAIHHMRDNKPLAAALEHASQHDAEANVRDRARQALHSGESG